MHELKSKKLYAYVDESGQDLKIKNRLDGKTALGMEPRGIEPLYPSVNHGFLTVRWPLELHRNTISQNKQKENPKPKASDFQDSIESVVDAISITKRRILSSEVIHS